MPLCTEAFESNGITSKAFYVIWGGYSEPETYPLQGGFVWLRWAVAEKLGEGESRGEAPKQRQVEKEPNCEPEGDSQLCPRTRRQN